MYERFLLAQPWITIERAVTPDGVLELRQRGERDFLILIDNRVLMNSSANRSETELGRLAAEAVAVRPNPRVLIGGLGMGVTLRAALDALPGEARILVAEINRVVESWCRGPLATLTRNALQDPRVRVEIGDVSAVIARAAKGEGGLFDAVIIDLYEGPGPKTHSQDDPFYGSKALLNTHRALSAGGIFGVWGENPDAAFEKRLGATGFSFERWRPGRGGLRHVVYVAKKK